jgi:predicted esterase
MSSKQSSQEEVRQLQRMAQRAGLRLSEADLAFLRSFRPYRADQRARAALQSSRTVQVTTTEDQIAFLPHAAAAVGLIFYPGAHVEAEAYAAFLHAMSEWGYMTLVPKMPLGLAIFGRDRAATLMAAYPAIQRWVLGGHSMGGGVACDFVATQPTVSGLLLYGTFCGCDLSHRNDLAVTVIYGTHDAVIPPALVIAARAKLPPQTRYIAIEGGTHAFFGDYGPQAGDGQAAISQEVARTQILEASLALLQEVTP